MDQRTTDEVIAILETDADFFVSVKKLWLTLQGKGLALDLELAEFYQQLLADDRLEFVSGVDHKEGFEDDPEFAEQMEREMEALGFYSGPRVKLVSREMTAADVFAAMSHSLTRMNEALQSAWDARPDDDQETENQLLEILAAGQKLEREVQELIEQPEQEEGQGD